VHPDEEQAVISKTIEVVISPQEWWPVYEVVDTPDAYCSTKNAAKLSFSDSDQTRSASPLYLARMHEEAESAE
jgi:hypothetical protein